MKLGLQLDRMTRLALRRAAIYGGTFDPVHNGHLEVARRVLELFELDVMLLVPACVPPHKSGISSAFHRFAMLALATETDRQLRLSTTELDEPDRPYAIDTVERMQTEMGPNCRLFFVIGADSWSEITTWHEWQRLLKMCDLIVSTRPGYDLAAKVPAGAANVFDVRGLTTAEISKLIGTGSGPGVFLTDAAMVDVSASGIRAAVRSNGQSLGQSDVGTALREMVPATVAGYIEKYDLYRN